MNNFQALVQKAKSLDEDMRDAVSVHGIDFDAVAKEFYEVEAELRKMGYFYSSVCGKAIKLSDIN